jgi:hypothetical protein
MKKREIRGLTTLPSLSIKVNDIAVRTIYSITLIYAGILRISMIYEIDQGVGIFT